MLTDSQLNRVQITFMHQLHQHVAGETWMYTLQPWATDHYLRDAGLELCNQELENVLHERRQRGEIDTSLKGLQSLGKATFEAAKPRIQVDREAFLSQYAACEKAIRHAIEQGRPITKQDTEIDSPKWATIKNNKAPGFTI